MALLLALDQGTSSTRAMLVDGVGQMVSEASCPVGASYPRDGWVEQDPEDIWRGCVTVMRACLATAGVGPAQLAGIGITNQRETVVIWERFSGRAIHPAIVWQDRRTHPQCERLRLEGAEPLIAERTGLVIDPYFSATKIAWLLDHVPQARERAEGGELLAGTIDSFLLWRLSDGARHITDATNASRTMLFDIVRQRWDDELLALMRIPRALLPEVVDCTGMLATTSVLGGSVTITGCAGDQQASAIAQGCLRPGLAKATFGTGCFILVHAGDTLPRSRHRLLTTIAYRIAGRCAYAIEGSIFNAGTVIEWLRDGLHAIPTSDACEALAAQADPHSGVYLVPAFTGLGAPYWDAQARGAILGLTRAATLADIVHAGLASVAFQLSDLLAAMAADGAAPTELRVDGGMSGNRTLMHLVAEYGALTVRRPVFTEATVRGAALLAGVGAGVYPSVEATAMLWSQAEHIVPVMDAVARQRRLAGWRHAVTQVRTPAPGAPSA